MGGGAPYLGAVRFELARSVPAPLLNRFFLRPRDTGDTGATLSPWPGGGPRRALGGGWARLFGQVRRRLRPGTVREHLALRLGLASGVEVDPLLAAPGAPLQVVGQGGEQQAHGDDNGKPGLDRTGRARRPVRLRGWRH